MFGSKPLSRKNPFAAFDQFGSGGFGTPPYMPSDEAQVEMGASFPTDFSAPQPKRGGIDVRQLGAFLLAANGNPLGGALIQQFGQDRRMADQTRQRAEQARLEGLQPREVGGNLVRLNQQTGQYEVVYQGPAKTSAPHYWETNDGSLGMIGPDGKPVIAYKDPTPKMNFIPDGLGGGQWVAVPSSAPSGLPVPAKPVGKLTPIRGGPTPSASGGFR